MTVGVETPLGQRAAFDAFADGHRYSEWLGVPVSISGRSFRATLEWGTEVRGTYEVVSTPDLIAMRWDFDDGAIPVPGQQLVAYLRVGPTPVGSRVVVHQLAGDEQHAAFLTDAWSMVLGRFAEAQRDRRAKPRRRDPRPKRRGGTS